MNLRFSYNIAFHLLQTHQMAFVSRHVKHKQWCACSVFHIQDGHYPVNVEEVSVFPKVIEICQELYMRYYLGIDRTFFLCLRSRKLI